MLVFQGRFKGMPELRIGTCSWKYREWEGIIYPSVVKHNLLVYYARHFNTVEIDQWFCSLFAPNKVRLPEPSTVREYTAAVPENFTFTIKVPNSITLTHFYRKKKSEPLQPNPYFLSPKIFHQFLERLEPMHSRLGALMFQFEYLNRQKMPSLARFLQLLQEFFQKIPGNFPYAIEIRNPNYLNRAFFQFLNNHGLGMVFLQGYFMPNIVSVYQKFQSLLGNLVIIRLHGPEREKMEERTGNRWDRIVVSREAEMEKIADMVLELLQQKKTVYVNVNNHYEGSAPLTIRRFVNILQSKQEGEKQ